MSHLSKRFALFRCPLFSATLNLTSLCVLTRSPFSPGSLLAELAFVGETLAPLESAERASSTLAWLDLVTSAPAADSPLLVKSLEFLLLKVDLCAIDVADSKFQQLAPFIHANGVAYEKRFFKKEWGEETVPAGINQFLSGLDSAPPLRSEWRNSFVEGVLFGKHGAMLPECFNRDTDLLMETRKAATVVSVVNSLVSAMGGPHTFPHTCPHTCVNKGDGGVNKGQRREPRAAPANRGT